MDTSREQSAFFEENIIRLNQMAEKILLFIIAVPAAFIVLKALGIFRISYEYSITMLAVCISVCAVEEILLHIPRLQRVATYFGLISINGIVCIMGMNNRVGIYISYCILPVISCLYYDKTLTKRISIISYLLMIVSLYVRSKTKYLEDLTSPTPNDWFFPVSVGFTMEYFIVYVTAKALTNRTSATMGHLIDTIAQRDQSNANLEDTQFKIIEFVSKCLGSHDLFTGQHVLHTRKYVEIICNKLVEKGYYTDVLTPETIELYSSAAFLHDIGKIHIPEGVLNKMGRFTPEEFELMKNHPEEGRKLLEFLPVIGDGSFNAIATQMAYTHHEKYDGSGYPNNLSKEMIPLCGRIMACADVLDALISKRLYKDPMSIEAAMNVFEESKGTHFEPCIAEAVIESKELIKTIDSNFKSVESQNDMAELSWWIRYHESQNKDGQKAE